MAKILSFRNKDGASSGQDFLTDETETLSFRTAEDGAVSLGDVSPDILPTPLPDPKKDWSNQELADLFRVRQLLGGAGVPVDTLRGVTDEGDPWFVYCHLNGDVFIHMARIDGLYVLDSPNVHRPLRGRNFNELIADFSNDALPTFAKAGEDTTERRVIKLERGGTVRLHPSAMLAALIWTLLLASDELVMLAPEEQALTGDDLLDFSDMISADTAAHTFLDTDGADLDAFIVPDAVKASLDAEGHPQGGAAEGHLQMREVMAQQGLAMHQNAFAMGLSTIAIAMGFMSEAVLLDNQRKVLEGLKTLGFTEYAAQTDAGPELEQIAGDGGDTLLATLADFLGLDLSSGDTEIATAPAKQMGESLLLNHGIEAETAVSAEVVMVTPKATTPLVRKDGDADLADAPAELNEIPTEAQQTLIALAAALDNADKISMSDLLGNTMQLEEFQLGQTTIMASFDVTKTDAFSLADYLFMGQRTTDHRTFDTRAQDFIDFIQSKDTEVGVITIGNEIIMIDRGAFQLDGADTYTFSWETDTGQVISMIGLRAEFQQFDLIA